MHLFVAWDIWEGKRNFTLSACLFFEVHWKMEKLRFLSFFSFVFSVGKRIHASLSLIVKVFSCMELRLDLIKERSWVSHSVYTDFVVNPGRRIKMLGYKIPGKNSWYYSWSPWKSKKTWTSDLGINYSIPGLMVRWWRHGNIIEDDVRQTSMKRGIKGRRKPP